MITGANTGIGLETAKELARLGATVYVACRDDNRGLAAVDVVKQYGGHDRVHFMRLDLADLSSVRKFVKKCNKKRIEIDLLINNAGTT